GAMTLMFSMIAIAGCRIIMTHGMDRRETLIVATSLGLGLGVSYDPSVFRVLPDALYVLVENPICAGGITAIIMNLVLPQSRTHKAKTAAKALKTTDAVEVIQLSDKPDVTFTARPVSAANRRDEEALADAKPVAAVQVERV
ncbi:solute carrier family 23 protein, partial [Aeromonas sp. HMWF016]|uniref:solute carrier family 23 protein n=1 Tax=Aeromonas sp. HMWF016 TaxID=2056852 RepID=UPI00280BBA19